MQPSYSGADLVTRVSSLICSGAPDPAATPFAAPEARDQEQAPGEDVGGGEEGRAGAGVLAIDRGPGGGATCGAAAHRPRR